MWEPWPWHWPQQSTGGGAGGDADVGADGGTRESPRVATGGVSVCAFQGYGTLKNMF